MNKSTELIANTTGQSCIKLEDNIIIIIITLKAKVNIRSESHRIPLINPLKSQVAKVAQTQNRRSESIWEGVSKSSTRISLKVSSTDNPHAWRKHTSLISEYEEHLAMKCFIVRDTKKVIEIRGV